MAAAGSAVGLGNIWKFPYEAGENGGGAFLIVYLVCVVLFGLPLVMTEFVIGQRSGKGAFGAFRELRGNSRWQWLSWMCMFSVMIMMGFYFVVTGWCVNYLWEMIIGSFSGMDTQGLMTHFQRITTNTPRMILCSVIPIAMTAAVLWAGVNEGIERLSKILMPLLLVMMLIMVGRVLMLDNSSAGLRFFFKMDFAKITPQVVMEAVGQCFFSLSVGLGTLITYGAYMSKNQKVTSVSLQVVILDTIVAVLAGIIIFPAVFSFGFNPAEGPELVFVVLPAIFEQMSFSWLSGVLFFLLLFIAALTSTISLMEVAVAFICEASEKKASKGTGKSISRHLSVLIVAVAVCVLSTLCVMSMTGQADWMKVAGRDLFDLFNDLGSLVLLPLGGLCMALFVGWFMPKHYLSGFPEETGTKRLLRSAYLFVVRWVAPLTILLILLNGFGII